MLKRCYNTISICGSPAANNNSFPPSVLHYFPPLKLVFTLALIPGLPPSLAWQRLPLSIRCPDLLHP